MSRRLVVERCSREVCPRNSRTRNWMRDTHNVLMRVIAGMHERYGARGGDKRIVDLRITFGACCGSGSLASTVV